MLIGYARVSKTEQDTELQLRALRKAGVRKLYEEHRSAVKTRAQLVQLLDHLREGDTVVVYKLDRLARSVRDLLGIVDRIEAAGATFRSLTESFDTTTPAGKMAFQMLGAVAEFERNIIRERSMAGLEVAKANGVRLGRLPALNERQRARLAGSGRAGATARPSWPRCTA
jgi:DNA invertase Pin-like site-specific DNA recombinase